MDELCVEQINRRYENVVNRVKRAAQTAGRDPKDIRIMVVTKSQSIAVTEAVIASGATILGENYVEDALPKIAVITNPDIEWHMIGHVQSRKTRHVSENFSWIHSIDREKIALRLSRHMGELGGKLKVLLECNVSRETSKFGYPAWNHETQTQLADEIEPILDLPYLEYRGLMTVPPWNPDPECSRKYYKRLFLLRNALAKNFPHNNWDDLSMGMSNDFEVAIQEGATIVRIGTAIVGPRK
jgi:pyridoxal phosphate enzyme (YggS family)